MFRPVIIHATSLSLRAETQPEGLHNNHKFNKIGAYGGQLQDSGSVARGGRSSWPGLEQELGRMKVVGDCLCELPL